jgi:hypothetical protein
MDLLAGGGVISIHWNVFTIPSKFSSSAGVVPECPFCVAPKIISRPFNDEVSASPLSTLNRHHDLGERGGGGVGRFAQRCTSYKFPYSLRGRKKKIKIKIRETKQADIISYVNIFSNTANFLYYGMCSR